MAGYNNSFKKVSFAGRKARYRLLSDLGESAEPCSACGATVVLIHCMELKGEIVSNFIFQFVSPGFIGNTLLEGIREGFLTKTSFSCHQPEMTEVLWLAV